MAIRYVPKVYRAQGSTKLVVASGGEIEIESGGYLSLESGGSIIIESGSSQQVQSGGYVSVESGGIVNYESGGLGQIAGTAAIPDASGRIYGVSGFKDYFEAATTTGMASYGISVISSGLDSGGLFFPIGVPIAGVRKTIIAPMRGAVAVIRGGTSAGALAVFDSSGTTCCYISLSTNYCAISMVGSSAGTKYLVTGVKYTASTLTTDVIFATTS